MSALMRRGRDVPASDDFSLALGRAVARHLEADVDAVRAVADRKLNRARAQYDVEPQWIRQWQQLIGGPVEALVEVLTSPDESARVLRQSSPFAGVLTPRERWAILAEVKKARRTDRRVSDHGRPGPARTHEGFNGEAERRVETIDGVATAAARALRQAAMGLQLAVPLGDDERSWLDANLGGHRPR